jgi:cytoskeletal protein CcmA (bactofilin family)
MTMFTKNDKMPDQQPVSPAPSARVEALHTPEIKRPQPPAQHVAHPVSAVAAPQQRGVSVISKALKITGQLESTEDIQVDGQIDGDVRGMSVKVGSNARVKGTVYGEEVELSGTVEGKIEAKKVVLTGTAHMAGDVIHQDITIHSGAFIDGHCRPEFGKTDARKTVPVHKPANGLHDVPERAAEKANGI